MYLQHRLVVGFRQKEPVAGTIEGAHPNLSFSAYYSRQGKNLIFGKSLSPTPITINALVEGQLKIFLKLYPIHGRTYCQN